MGCCDYNPAVAGSGIPGLPGSGSTSGSISTRGGGGGAPRGLLERVGAALDQAIHGGDSSVQGAGAGSGGSGSNIIPFPMVNAYKPAIQSRAPISGLTAFPVGVRVVPDESAQTTGIPDDEQGFSGLGGLGLGPFDAGAFDEYPTVSSGGKLQTVIGGIAAILPATIQAIRANPSNIYPTQVYNPYNTAGSVYPGQQGAGADIGARTGAAVGNIGDTFSNIVTQHPLLVLGAGAALLLLFMNPPRRR